MKNLFKALENNTPILLLGVVIVGINCLLGHYFAPLGIVLTPLVIIITSLLVIWGVKDLNIIYKSILVYLFITMNDILIKLFSGGTLDQIGLALISISLLVGVLFVLTFFVINIFQENNSKMKDKIIAFLVFLVLIIIYFSLFTEFGFRRYS